MQTLSEQQELRVRDWFTGRRSTIETFEAGNSATLDDEGVRRLVDAMAAFAPSGSSVCQWTESQREAVEPVIATAWTSAA